MSEMKMTNQDFYQQQVGLKVMNPDYFTTAVEQYVNEEMNFLIGRLKGLSILDVGCGPARYLKILASQVPHIVGIDYSDQMVEIAKTETSHLKNVRVIKCAAEDLLQCVEGHFDAAILTWNTFGNMDKEKHYLILKNLRQASNSVYISVYRVGKIPLQERLAFYEKLAFEVVGITDDTVHLKAEETEHISFAFPEGYYEELFMKAGFSPRIHLISTLGLIVEGRSVDDKLTDKQ